MNASEHALLSKLRDGTKCVGDASLKKLRVGNMARSATIEVRAVRSTCGLTRFSFSLSSEYAVDRGWGKREILSHHPSAVRLGRVKAGAMPLLFNHNHDDPVGVVDSASVASGKLSVEGNFFSTQRGKDVASMVASGLRNVSVGYRIFTIEDDDDSYTVTDWEPYEASIAPVPADPTVGTGRAA